MVKFNNLVTKGLGNRRQTLVIWGLHVSEGIDIVVGPGPGSQEHYERYLDQHKTIWFRKDFRMCGCKEFDFRGNIKIKGQLLKEFIEAFNLKGAKNIQFKFNNKVLGSKLFIIFDKINLKGTRLIDISEYHLVRGAKRIRLSEHLNVSGRRNLDDLMASLTLLDII